MGVFKVSWSRLYHFSEILPTTELKNMLRTFQVKNVKKIRTFSFGSASAAKLYVPIKKECICDRELLIVLLGLCIKFVDDQISRSFFLCL